MFLSDDGYVEGNDFEKFHSNTFPRMPRSPRQPPHEECVRRECEEGMCKKILEMQVVEAISMLILLFRRSICYGTPLSLKLVKHFSVFSRRL